MCHTLKKATGYDIQGKAKESNEFIHLINSVATCQFQSSKSLNKSFVCIISVTCFPIINNIIYIILVSLKFIF